MTRSSWEKTWHRLFQVGILFKGLDGLLETLGGLVFLIFSQGALVHFVFSLTQSELIEDPDDWLANSLRRAFAHLSGSNKLFVGAYLLGHGIIKLFLVVGLWRDKLWIFPVAIGLLVAFIGYQVFRMVDHFSIGLALASGLDLIIIGLVAHEYWSKRKEKKRA